MNNIQRNVGMVCPTCGCTQFACDEPDDGHEYSDDSVFTCAHCGGAFTRAQLIEANSGSIDAAVEEMKDEILSQAASELEKALKGLNVTIKL